MTHCERAAKDISLNLETQVCSTHPEIPPTKAEYPTSTTTHHWGVGWSVGCQYSWSTLMINIVCKCIINIYKFSYNVDHQSCLKCFLCYTRSFSMQFCWWSVIIKGGVRAKLTTPQTWKRTSVSEVIEGFQGIGTGYTRICLFTSIHLFPQKETCNPEFVDNWTLSFCGGVSQDECYTPEFPISVRYPSPLSDMARGHDMTWRLSDMPEWHEWHALMPHWHAATTWDMPNSMRHAYMRHA